MILKPFIGIDNIKFGMDEDEVNQIAGEPQGSSHTLIDDLSIVNEQIRNNAVYLFDEGRLACIIFDVEALIKNKIMINGETLPPMLFELLKTLKGLTNKRIEIRYPSAYFYPELGLVIYYKETFDIRIGRQHRTSNHMVAICDPVSFAKYGKYFLTNMKQTENVDTRISDALRQLLEEYDEVDYEV